MYVGSFITSFAMKPLNKILGRKITFILGGIIGISGCLWITFCLKDDENVKYYVYFATSLIGIGGSTMMVTSLSLVNWNPIPTRHIHVIYCNGYKNYPCLVGIGLTIFCMTSKNKIPHLWHHFKLLIFISSHFLTTVVN